MSKACFVECSICGKTSNEPKPEFDIEPCFDLDGKPNNVEIKKIYPIYECRNCGFVSHDIKYCSEIGEEFGIINSTGYRNLMNIEDKYLSRLYRLIMIEEQLGGNSFRIGESYMIAYWYYIEKGISDEKKYLLKANQVYVEIAEELLKSLTRFTYHYKILLTAVETERLLGHFNEAAILVNKILENKKQLTKNQIKTFKYELKLCKSEDSKRHSFSDIKLKKIDEIEKCKKVN